jgi:hypothetical protein
VRVKSYPEILATLDSDNKTRGLYFDAEHVPYCGKEFPVRSLVKQIIDERTGRMLRFKSPSIILEGVYCQGTYSDDRFFHLSILAPGVAEARGARPGRGRRGSQERPRPVMCRQGAHQFDFRVLCAAGASNGVGKDEKGSCRNRTLAHG